MSTQPIYAIKDKAPEFPCWMWQSNVSRWIRHESEDSFGPLASVLCTHWSPDAPTAPTAWPQAEVPPVFSYNERADWENMPDADLNRVFAREFWDRPIDERNNTYWHDDDKTPKEENHEWKPLPDFCNDWSAVRGLLVESRFVLPVHHGVPQDKRSRCRRAIVDMLILKRCSKRPAIIARHAPTVEAEALARQFHDTYERLAPLFGYETRKDTKRFDPTTPNGRLMIAVCSEIASHAPAAAAPDAGLREAAQAAERWMTEHGCSHEYPVLINLRAALATPAPETTGAKFVRENRDDLNRWAAAPSSEGPSDAQLLREMVVVNVELAGIARLADGTEAGECAYRLYHFTKDAIVKARAAMQSTRQPFDPATMPHDHDHL